MALGGCAVALPLMATVYSAILAMGISFGLPASSSLVILIEIILLAVTGVIIAKNGLVASDGLALTFIFISIVLALLVSIQASRLMVEVIRSGLIIGLFSLLGQRVRMEAVDRIFLVLAAIVGAVLVLEIFFPQVYVAIFHPAAFYELTRDIETNEFNNTGLFNTATSYEGRFSFGFFEVPRTSSIFLEQISNANFAMILAMYTAARWETLGGRARKLFIAVISLIIISTNSRFGSFFVLTMLVGFFVYPKLPRWMTIFAIAAIWSGIFVVNLFYDWNHTDDLIGRISFIGHSFRETDWQFYLGGHARFALAERDSGYTYVIGTSTVFGFLGFIAYWLCYPRADDAASRRLLWGLVIYMCGQLAISSTSLLSIKTAALLWFLIGAMRSQSPPSKCGPGLAQERGKRGTFEGLRNA